MKNGKNPEKAFETGLEFFNNSNFDMASLYFESAGKIFLFEKHYEKALQAYTKLEYCLLEGGSKKKLDDAKKMLQNIEQLIKESK